MAVAAAISQSWFRPDSFIAQGDIPPFIRTSLMDESGWVWNHDQTGAGSVSFQIIRGVEVLLVKAADLVGGSEVAAQRVFYALLLALVALGASLFARSFTTRRAAVVLAGLFGCLNPFVLTHVPNPVVLCALAFMGISGSMVVQAGRGAPPPPFRFALSTVGFSYLLLNLPTLVIAVGWLLGLVLLASALVGPGGTRQAAGFVGRSLPWVAALNLWWLVPGLLTFLGSGAVEVAVSKDIRTWSWTHGRGSIANVLSLNATWGWKYPEYFPFAGQLDAGYWRWLRFVAPVVALSAPLLSSGARRRAAVSLVSVLLGLVLVGKGLHPPVTGMNLWLYDHLPGFWLLREPFSKVGPAMVLVYVALLAVSVDAILGRIGAPEGQTRHPLAAVALALGAVAMLAYPYPLWTGQLFPDTKVGLPSAQVRVPVGWRAAAAFVNERSTRGKALVLPLADFYQMPTTWGYYGADVIPKILLRRPSIQVVPENYFLDAEGFATRVRDVEKRLLEGRVDEVSDLLRQLGVSHVVLRRDLDLTFPNRSFADPRRLARALAEVPSLGRSRTFDVAEVYEVTGAQVGEVQLRDDAGRPVREPALTWERHNPTRYSITVAGLTQPVTLVLTESYDPEWRLTGVPEGIEATHQRIDGYANAWRLGGAGTFTVTAEYRPARLARAAMLVSAAAALLAAALSVQRRARAAASRRRPTGTGPGPSWGSTPTP